MLALICESSSLAGCSFMAPNGSLYLLLLFFITMDGSTLFLVVLYVESSKATTSICILEDGHSLKAFWASSHTCCKFCSWVFIQSRFPPNGPPGGYPLSSLKCDELSLVRRLSVIIGILPMIRH